MCGRIPSKAGTIATSPTYSGGTRGLRERGCLGLRCRGGAATARQSAYDAAVSGEPVIRSGFDVYLNGNTLAYVRETCARGDTEARFFLHLWPVDGDDLPGNRKRLGFDNLGFSFVWVGAVFDGRCMAKVTLPGYAIARIDTGQYVRAGGDFRRLWEGEIRLGQ